MSRPWGCTPIMSKPLHIAAHLEEEEIVMVIDGSYVIDNERAFIDAVEALVEAGHRLGWSRPAGWVFIEQALPAPLRRVLLYMPRGYFGGKVKIGFLLPYNPQHPQPQWAVDGIIIDVGQLDVSHWAPLMLGPPNPAWGRE